MPLRTKQLFIGILLLLTAIPGRAATLPSTVPSTAPTTRLSDMESLADGMVRYLPPEKWDLLEKTPEGLTAKYRSHDHTATIAITVTPLDRAVVESSRDQMASVIIKAMRESAVKAGQQFAEPPRAEADDRFFLRIHDATKVEDGVVERIQIYRVMGLNMVHVAATASGDELETSGDVFAKAEKLMLMMRLSRGAKRVIYPHAQLRAIVPLDWNDQKTDQANGVVATYTDPKDPTRQIILSARIIPKSARDDKTKLDAFIATMNDQERKLPARLTEGKIEEPPTTAATSYLKQSRQRVTLNGEVTLIDARYLVVGDVLASVRSIAKEPDADAVNVVADKFAAALKPISDH